MPYLCGFTCIFCGHVSRRSFVCFSSAKKCGQGFENSVSITPKRQYFFDKSAGVRLGLSQLFNFFIEFFTDNIEKTVIATLRKCFYLIRDMT